MNARRILVVDDETSFLDIMNVILPRAGFEIITSTHGTEGLKMIYECQPDLALLDDMLPGMSGGDICLSVKSDPTMRHLPVVLYSAGPRVRDGEFIRRVGADAVLYKPFKPADVVSTINNCLRSGILGAAV
jgi:DNA-binding response OmpR family regulator